MEVVRTSDQKDNFTAEILGNLIKNNANLILALSYRKINCIIPVLCEECVQQ